jgi:hypothetical protein
VLAEIRGDPALSVEGHHTPRSREKAEASNEGGGLSCQRKTRTERNLVLTLFFFKIKVWAAESLFGTWHQ